MKIFVVVKKWSEVILDIEISSSFIFGRGSLENYQDLQTIKCA